ncbi:hypothetical protein [Achromobacter mucicolens]|uniref:hypothetical protein n=1 Tax=Achromobacter mucicolens TaxID=1389922 RepID=UPI00158150DF|nr:hypothetical protein [Achromobacter mucicolens]
MVAPDDSVGLRFLAGFAKIIEIMGLGGQLRIFSIRQIETSFMGIYASNISKLKTATKFNFQGRIP